MATDLRPPKETARHDTFVAGQLARAEQRIRALDLAAGFLGLLAGVLLYAALIALCDHRLDLAPRVRKIGFCIFALAAGVYAWLFFLLPLRRRVNPYYAAREVEKALPGARNSIVNWVDLHNQDLPAPIHGVLGQRAARDLGRVDLDQAISGRHAGRAALAATVLAAVAFVLFLWWGSTEFGYRLGRAFAPFRAEAAAVTQTRLTVVRPQGGNALVTFGRAVRIEAQIEGAVPDVKAADAPQLHYRYQPSEEYRSRPLQREEDRWSITLPASDVRDGFWYKVSAGDAETPEYRIGIRPAPKIVDFQATYHYRDYVGRADEIRGDRKLEALRGTTVALRVRTNRTLGEGRLDLKNGEESQPAVPGERIAEDPECFEVRLTLDKAGSYRLHFRSEEGETFTEKAWSLIVVIPDRPPQVELTVPGKDVELPANGILRLEGKASDDVGVEKLTLRAEVVQGAKLKEKPFRGGSLRLPSGGSPRAVEYHDFLDLTELRTEDGARVSLPVGATIKYWLEARDGCDFPKAGGQAAESKPYHVRILAPEGQPERQRDRQQAEQEQQQQDARQDEQMKKEDEARQEERKQQEARQKEEQRKREEQRKQEEAQKEKGKQPEEKKDGSSEQKQDGQTPSNEKNDRNPGDGKNDKGQGGKPGSEEQGKDQQPAERQSGPGEAKDGGRGSEGTRADRELERKLERAQQQLDQEPKPGEGQREGEPKPGDGNTGQQSQPGREKPSGDKRNESGRPGAKPTEKPEGNEGTPGTRQDHGGQPEGPGGDKRPMNPGAEQPSGPKPNQPGTEAKPSPTRPGESNPHRENTPNESTGSKPGERSDGSKNGSSEEGPKSPKKEPASGNTGASPDNTQQPGNEKTGTGDKRPGERKEPGAGSKPGERSQGKQNGDTEKGRDPGEKNQGSGASPDGDKRPGSKEPGNGNTERKDRGKLTDEQIEQLARRLSKMSKDERAEMVRKQEQARAQANDPDEREDARRLLEALKRLEEQKNGSGKPGGQDNPQAPPEGNENGSNDRSRPGDTSSSPKGNPSGKPSEGKPGEGKPGESGTPGNPNGAPPRKGKRPGDRADAPQNPQAQDNPGNDSGKPKPTQAGKPRLPRATLLQLEGLDALKRKQLLDKVGLSEVDYQTLRKRYLRPTPPAGEEKPATPGGVSLPSIGSQRTREASQGGDTGSDNKGQPPPGYRNARLKFARELETGGQR